MDKMIDIIQLMYYTLNTKLIEIKYLKIEETEVYLYTDGTPCVIDIHYKGSIAVYSNDINFKISYIRNKIRIVNLFGKATKELLFTFDGNVDFIDSEILGYNGEIVKPNIEKNNKQKKGLVVLRACQMVQQLLHR